MPLCGLRKAMFATSGSHGEWDTMACRIPWRARYHGVQDTMACRIPWRVGYHGEQDTMACRIPWCVGYHLARGIPWRVGHHAGYLQSDSGMWFPTAGDHRFTTTVGPISYGWKYTAVSERIGHFLADPFPSSSPAHVGAPASSSRFRARSFSA